MRNFTILIFALVLTICANAQMVLEYNTNLSAGTEIRIPLLGGTDVTIDWGDGTSPESFYLSSIYHTYTTDGVYTVTVNGSSTRFGINTSIIGSDKLVRVVDFGDLGLTNLSYAFYNTENLIEVPSTIPTGITDMNHMFYGASAFNGDISSWDVSSVTNMYGMFRLADAFNQDIGLWDVSNVTDMTNIFKQAPNFNQNIGSWDVSNVISLAGAFSRADAFNQNIGAWNVSNVTDMNGMFNFAETFNQAIGSWDVSNVTQMNTMFYEAYAFNQDIGAWNVANVTHMRYMFYESLAFNQDLNNWDVSNVMDMHGMFMSAESFNGNISSWDVSNVTNMASLFRAAIGFNQDIGLWDVSNVTDMSTMFSVAIIFNQDIGSWDVSNVTDMSTMFSAALAFNGNIGSWDVSNVISMFHMFSETEVFNQYIGNWNTSNVSYMSDMFSEALAFNQDISSWDVSNVTIMLDMFRNTGAFNQDISSWDVSSVIYMQNMFSNSEYFNQNIGAWNVSNVTNMDGMFAYSTLSTTNYDALLNGWSTQTLQSNINFHGGNSQYSCNGEAARNILLNSPNSWTVIDAGITNITENMIFEIACNSYTSPSGNYIWYTSGAYNDTIPNSCGSDSLITIDLTVFYTDNTITQDSATLTAIAVGIAYQWLDCDNSNSPISGATEQTYVATAYGNYSVEVTDGSCIDTSDCISFQSDTILIQNPNEYTVANQEASVVINNCSIVYEQVDSASIYDYSYIDESTAEITIRVYYNSTYTEIVENINTTVLDVYEVEMIISCSNKSSGNPVLKIIDYIDTGIYTSIDNLSLQNIKLYPNPTTGQIQIAGKNIKQVEIYNLSGVLIQSTSNKAIDLSQEAKGIYFVKVTTANGVATQKLILE